MASAQDVCTKGVWLHGNRVRRNIILDPIMHGKCTMHARKGRGLRWNRVDGMKLV